MFKRIRVGSWSVYLMRVFSKACAAQISLEANSFTEVPALIPWNAVPKLFAPRLPNGTPVEPTHMWAEESLVPRYSPGKRTWHMTRRRLLHWLPQRHKVTRYTDPESLSRECSVYTTLGNVVTFTSIDSCYCFDIVQVYSIHQYIVFITPFL